MAKSRLYGSALVAVGDRRAGRSTSRSAQTFPKILNFENQKVSRLLPTGFAFGRQSIEAPSCLQQHHPHLDCFGNICLLPQSRSVAPV